MRAWWDALELRERLVLVVAALLMAALLVERLGWAPLREDNRLLERRLAAGEELRAWMAGAVEEVERLRAAPRPEGGSLLGLVERSVRAGELAGALKRIEPAEEAGVRLRLEGVAFDPLIRWLVDLANHQGVHVRELHLERKPEAGRVDVRLTLGR